LAADCGEGCPPGWIVEVESLQIRRKDSQASLSTNFDLPDFDREDGVRLTVSSRTDCLEGWEFSYTGSLEWTSVRQLNAVELNFSPGINGINVSAFNNAVFQRQSYRSELNSFELNRKWWGWDVIETSAGVRYIKIDENFVFNSTDAGGNTGLFRINTNNEMVGAQYGMALSYPVGRLSAAFRLKGGLFLNSVDSDTFLRNAGVVQINNAHDSLRVSFLGEVGWYVGYQVSSHIKVQVGYELWWLYGLATVSDQNTSILREQTGTSLDDNAAVYYQGTTVGVVVDW
jgi:hypothetical protein